MTVKNIIFRYVNPHSLVEVYRRFGGKNCRHIQGLRVSQVSELLFAPYWLLVLFTFHPDDGNSTFHCRTTPRDTHKLTLLYESINEFTHTSKWCYCYTRRFGADPAYFCQPATARSYCFVQLPVCSRKCVGYPSRSTHFKYRLHLLRYFTV